MTMQSPSLDFAQLQAQLQDKDREIEQLHAQIEELSRHDPLTGVLNRRSLLQALEAELQRSRRTGHPFCFAVIDLDHFKSINDQYGEPIGDLVLKNLSDAASMLLRVLDRFGRLGGEEFGILLPATWLDQGVLAMNRLTTAVADSGWDRIMPGLRVTFSVGLTTNAPMDTPETMLKRAKQALAQAKRQGRSQLVQIEEPLPGMGACVE